MGEARGRGTRDQRIAQAIANKTGNTAHKELGGYVAGFLSKGIDLEAHIVERSLTIREQSKQKYLTEWLDARLTLLSITKHLLGAKHLKPGRTSEQSSKILTLLMAFFQGVPASETLISEGQYIKAAAVLKQDYEILVRIAEVHAGVDRPGITPQAKYFPEEARRYYGDLNKVAHPSNQEYLESLLARLNEDGISAISCSPIYSFESSMALYELHIWLILMAVREYIRLFGEMYGTEDSAYLDSLRWFAHGARLLEKAGFVFEASEGESNKEPADFA